jgi:hypothetical protein
MVHFKINQKNTSIVVDAVIDKERVMPNLDSLTPCKTITGWEFTSNSLVMFPHKDNEIYILKEIFAVNNEKLIKLYKKLNFTSLFVSSTRPKIRLKLSLLFFVCTVTISEPELTTPITSIINNDQV